MNTLKFLDPKNDFAFKKVFGTEKNKEILIRFLNDLLDTPRPIESIQFLKTNQEPEIAAKKQSIVDVLCRDDQGHQYIVEMQVVRSESFIKRAQLYAAKAYASQLDAGERYECLKPVIFLAITDFIMFKDKPGFLSHHVILDKKHLTQDLKDFSFTFLELPKFVKTLDELDTNIDRWAFFLKHAHHTTPEELEKLTSDEVIIGRAYRAIDQFYWSADELALYEREVKRQLDAQAILDYAVNTGERRGYRKGCKKGREDGLKKGLAEGLKKGLEKGLEQGLEEGRQEGRHEGLLLGKKENTRDIALKLMAVGADMKMIGKVTGLPPDELSELLDSLQTTL